MVGTNITRHDLSHMRKHPKWKIDQPPGGQGKKTSAKRKVSSFPSSKGGPVELHVPVQELGVLRRRRTKIRNGEARNTWSCERISWGSKELAP